MYIVYDNITGEENRLFSTFEKMEEYRNKATKYAIDNGYSEGLSFEDEKDNSYPYEKLEVDNMDFIEF